MDVEKALFLVAIKEKIRQAKADGQKTVFFNDLDGVERVYFVNKYGAEWLEKASYKDIIRVSPR